MKASVGPSSDSGISPQFVPSWRRIYEQSWWIASELARSQSRLRIIETHPGDGMYDCLHIGDDGVTFTADGTISLNRHGTMHTHGGPTDNLTWADALAAESPHDVVKELERRMGWRVTVADRTTPRTLAYRAISRLLTRTINDRESWIVRQLEPHNAWLDYREPALRQDFPTVGSAFGVLAEGRPGLWALLCEKQVTLVVGEDGRLHRRDAEVLDLMRIYGLRRKLDDVLEPMLDA